LNMAHSVRVGLAVVSAIFIWIAALLQVLQNFNVTGGDALDFGDPNIRNGTRLLDPTTLRAYWAYKRSQLGIDVTVDLLAALGLAFLAWVVLILKRVFKRYKNGESDLPSFMAASFFIGAFLPSVEFLESLGFTTTADLISQSPSLPDIGIQTLHVAYYVDRGSSLYLFSSQFICVSTGILAASWLSWKTGELPKKHAIFGYITAVFGYLCFIFEIVTFNAGNRVGYALGVFVVIYGVFLLPIWTIWLGFELRKIKNIQKQDARENMDKNLVPMKDLPQEETVDL